MRKIKDERYRKLQELADLIDDWPAADVLQAIHDQLDDDRSEAQDYYDARTERWQESEKGEQYQEWLYRLEDVVNALDGVISAEKDDLEDAIQNYFDVFSDLTQAPEGV